MAIRQNTITRRLLYLLAFLFVTNTGFAQETDEFTLVISQPLTVTLVAGGIQLKYVADKAGVVTVTARSLEEPGIIDTTVEILGSDGRRVPGGYNDDQTVQRPHLSERDSVIENVVLPVPGLYTLRLYSFNGVDTGKVEVTLETADIFGATIEESGPNTVIQATLPPNHRYAYAFDAVIGTVLTVTARDTSGTLDPLLVLRDADGRIIAQNDDHMNTSVSELATLDAQISGFEITTSGTYTIEVRDFTGAAGTFELTINRA
jgi:hypothetical protein